MTYVERLKECNLILLSYTREITDLFSWFYNLVHGMLNVTVDMYYITDTSLQCDRNLFMNTGIVKGNLKP